MIGWGAYLLVTGLFLVRVRDIFREAVKHPSSGHLGLIITEAIV